MSVHQEYVARYPFVVCCVQLVIVIRLVVIWYEYSARCEAEHCYPQIGSSAKYMYMSRVHVIVIPTERYRSTKVVNVTFFTVGAEI